MRVRTPNLGIEWTERPTQLAEYLAVTYVQGAQQAGTEATKQTAPARQGPGDCGTRRALHAQLSSVKAGHIACSMNHRYTCPPAHGTGPHNQPPFDLP
jgi:hypothetical protein